MYSFRIVLFCFSFVAFLSLAQDAETDVPQSKDHPLISRYKGSWLVAWDVKPFDEAILPQTYELGRGVGTWAKPLNLEGEITTIYYVGPPDRSALEIHRNYADAMLRAGGTQLLSCSKEDCMRAERTLQSNANRFVDELPDSHRIGSIAFSSTNWGVEPHHAIWKLPSGGGTYVDILTMTIRVESTTVSDGTAKRAITAIRVIRPHAMETGKVPAAVTGKVLQITAEQMGARLDEFGHIALYGILFDKGKSEVKAEATAELAEVGRMLSADRYRKLNVVCHTANEGPMESLALSQKRADAIVTVLTIDYKIDAGRLTGKGLGAFAPVASNADETGRALNRRVELVER